MPARRSAIARKTKPIRKTRRHSYSRQHPSRRVPLLSEKKQRSIAIRKLATARRKNNLSKMPQKKRAKIPQKYFKMLQKIDLFDLRCPICMSLMQIPIKLSCNHSTCMICFEKMTVHNSRCPICRSNETKIDLPINYQLEGVIKAYISQNSDLQKEFNQNRKEALREQRKRLVNPDKVQESDYIDVKDQATYRWILGRVYAIQDIAGRRHKLLTVRIPDKHKWLVVNTLSREVATAGYFTQDSRIGLPKQIRKSLLEITKKYHHLLKDVDEFERQCKVSRNIVQIQDSLIRLIEKAQFMDKLKLWGLDYIIDIMRTV